jgi:hypothetical protein
MLSGNSLVDRHEEEDVPEQRDYCYECKSSPCRCEEYKEKREEELMAYCPTFEDFLWEKHAEQYAGSKDCMVEDAEDWIDMLEAHEISDYAEEYGKKCFKLGREIK